MRLQEMQDDLDRESSSLQDLESQKQDAQERLEEMDQQRSKLEGMLNDVQQKCQDESHMVSVQPLGPITFAPTPCVLFSYFTPPHTSPFVCLPSFPLLPPLSPTDLVAPDSDSVPGDGPAEPGSGAEPDPVRPESAAAGGGPAGAEPAGRPRPAGQHRQVPQSHPGRDQSGAKNVLDAFFIFISIFMNDTVSI